MEAESREAHTFEDSASSALVEELLTALGRLPDGGAGTRWSGVRSLFCPLSREHAGRPLDLFSEFSWTLEID